MVEHVKSFAARLKALREAAGLSQYAVAKRSGLSVQALSRLELGDREPKWVTVQRLAVALGVSCEAFIDPTIQAVPTAVQPRGRPRKMKTGEAPHDFEPAAKKRPRGRAKGKGG